MKTTYYLPVILLSVLIFSCKSSSTIPSTSSGSGEITYAGGDGSSYEEAILIKGASGSMDGVPAEYDYLEEKYGPQGNNWQMISQSLQHNNGRSYDVLSIKFAGEDQPRNIYFDITEFFGKL